MSPSSSTSKRRQRGAAMVEMAILGTLLVSLFLGITELGRALFWQHKLTQAVETGARFLGRAWQAVDQDACTETANWPAAVESAKNIAVYGSVSGGSDPAFNTLSPDHFTATVTANDVADVGTVCVIRVTANVPYIGILFGDKPPALLGGGEGWILFAASEERYVGE